VYLVSSYIIPVNVYGCLCGLTGSKLDHRSLPTELDSLHGHIWGMFHLWLCFITIGGHSTNLVYRVHKNGCKTPIIRPINVYKWSKNNGTPQSYLGDILYSLWLVMASANRLIYFLIQTMSDDSTNYPSVFKYLSGLKIIGWCVKIISDHRYWYSVLYNHGQILSGQCSTDTLTMRLPNPCRVHWVIGTQLSSIIFEDIGASYRSLLLLLPTACLTE